MTMLDMNPSTLPPDAQALYEKMAARRKGHGEGFGGPYLALLNHPELARRIEELGFFLKFEGALPRTIYQFIVLTIARTTGAGFEWQDHIEHARAAGLPPDVIDCIASARTDSLPQPYALVYAILTKTMAWQLVPDDLQNAGRGRMGQAWPGRNRGPVGFLSDVRGDQSGIRNRNARRRRTKVRLARIHRSSSVPAFAV